MSLKRRTPDENYLLLSKGISLADLTSHNFIRNIKLSYEQSSTDFCGSCEIHTSRLKEDEGGVKVIEDIIETNGYSCQQFVEHWKNVIFMKQLKINSLMFSGRSNTGKTLLCNLIKSGYVWGDADRGVLTYKNFPFERLIHKSLYVFEECKPNVSSMEDLKLIWGGEDIFVNIKGRQAEMLPRRPCVITMQSHDVMECCNMSSDKEALINRTYRYLLNAVIKPTVQVCFCDFIRFVNKHNAGGRCTFDFKYSFEEGEDLFKGYKKKRKC